MRFNEPLIPAEFISRPNRFLGKVRIGEDQTECFIPNPGRMGELLRPKTRVYLTPRSTENRKTAYDLSLVDLNGTLISVDSRVPNRIASEAIEQGKIPEFSSLRVEKAEYTYNDSRLDFLLSGNDTQLLLEVKSCTLVRGGTALFPDAPTKRGSRHLRTLMGGLAHGRAAILFIIQRPDAESFRPNEATDPTFAETLREASNLGVEVYAYKTDVSIERIALTQSVQVML
jgi:sugar fermentation stimulation protein A